MSDKLDTLLDALADKGFDLARCKFCGSDRTGFPMFGDDIEIGLPVFKKDSESDESEDQGRYIGLVLVGCANCGHISSFVDRKLYDYAGLENFGENSEDDDS